jgi:dihydroorotase
VRGSPLNLLIRGARVVDPSQGLDRVVDLAIENGRIKNLGASPPPTGVEVVDARGLVAVPGLIDMHVHLREPGFEYKETIATGTAAAAAGGFTAVASMANTEPPNDCAAVTEYILEKAAAAAKARVHPIGATTKALLGRELAEIGEMVAAGAVAVSDDGRPVSDPGVMRRAMEYAKSFDVPVIEHCETLELHPGGVMNEGYWSTALGLRGIPRASEEIAVARNVRLAELTGARLHVAHVSTKGALRSVREAKSRGLRVSCEVTPHHLLLTDERVSGYDTYAKMKPPLTTEEDREALLEGLRDGAVDAIATDHAPHHQDEKDDDFDSAPFGIVGLETAVALCLDRLVRPGIVSMSRLVELLSSGPARILKVEGGTLAPGARADVTLLDLERPFRVEPLSFLSKSRNTPFSGWEMTGRAVRTIVAGVTVWELSE